MALLGCPACCPSHAVAVCYHGLAVHWSDCFGPCAAMVQFRGRSEQPAVGSWRTWSPTLTVSLQSKADRRPQRAVPWDGRQGGLKVGREEKGQVYRTLRVTVAVKCCGISFSYVCCCCVGNPRPVQVVHQCRAVTAVTTHRRRCSQWSRRRRRRRSCGSGCVAPCCRSCAVVFVRSCVGMLVRLCVCARPQGVPACCNPGD